VSSFLLCRAKSEQAKDAGSVDSTAIDANEDDGMRRFAAGRADNRTRGREHGVTGRLLPIPAVAALAIGLIVPSSGASFNATTANRGNAYALTALYAPSGLTATPSGHDVALAWSAGSNGSGYSVLGVANGSSSDCSAASFASIGSASGTSYTDTGRYTPQGTWFCYQVKTSYASWTSVSGNPTAAAQLGVVATSVAAANGGTAGKLDTNDTITVNFNQPITTSTGPSGTNTVCAISGSTIVLGSTTTLGTCSASETMNLGKLAGGTSSANARWAATYTWTNSNKTLTVKLGTLSSGSAPTVSGAWTFNPTTTASKLLSATGSFQTCNTNTGGGNCLPTISGSF
jgi:hypothetical protein